jgi:cysteine desulfurase
MAALARTYLDHNASSPLRPEAAEALVRALALPGNPSSVHAEGRAAHAALERARDEVAALVGAAARSVVFTSGGTEAANTVLGPGFRPAGEGGATLLLAAATEHPCVLAGHRFPADAVELIPVDRDGIVDLGWLGDRLDREPSRRALVSIQLANNETGAVQPVAEAARLVHMRGGLVHSDAVQAAGRVRVDIRALGIDALTLSAHKLGGPKGVGAIVFASDRLEIADRLVRGGGQERGARAGTENVAGIVAFGAAAAAAAAGLEAERIRLAGLREEAEKALRAAAPAAVVFASGAERLVNTLAFAVPGLKAETALIAFDLDGVALSSGSACSSGKVKRSHVLDAMGVEPSLAEAALRVSFGWSSTPQDVIRFAGTCERVVDTLYKRRAHAA